MIKKGFSIPGIILFIIFTLAFVVAQDPYDGYTLFNAMGEKTYLIDMDGKVVESWDCDYAIGYVAHMLKYGIILRTANDPNAQLQGGGRHGIIQKINWDGDVIWEYKYSSSKYLAHHDVEGMPNGNVLIIAWEVKTASEATQAGCGNSKEIWPDHIIEVEPTGARSGDIVWEWHAWDHLIQDYDEDKDNYGVVKDHPELLNVNFKGKERPGSDWMHVNGIDYIEELNQIVFSSHSLDEFYVVDHSTTTEEAASHKGGKYGKGGDFLYRWGNPQAYDRGTSSDRKFYVIHDGHWIDSDLPGGGCFMAFNNGSSRPDGRYSTIDVIKPPIDDNGNYTIESNSPFGPEEQTWIYKASNPTDFYAMHLGSVQRLPNGNTLICEATKGFFFEIDSTGKTVWEYEHRLQTQIPQCHRYTEEQTGISQKIFHKKKRASIRNYPNPFSKATNICFNNPKKSAQVKIYSITGKELFCKWVKQDHFKWNAKKQPCGVYVVKVKMEEMVFSKYINLVR